jgi:hypothetical protein
MAHPTVPPDLTEALQGFADNCTRLVRELSEAMAPIHKVMQEVAAGIVAFQRDNPDFLKGLAELAQAMAKLPDHMRTSWQAAAGMGWYPNGETPLTAVGTGSEGQAKLDAFMMGHIQAGWETITADILAAVPHRREFLQLAFDLHKERRYGASIPLFFAHADGICEEKLGVFLFADQDKRTKVIAEMQAADPDAFLAILLDVMGLKTHIRTRIDDAAAEAHKKLAPNRHGILHGAQSHLDYATEINSLKVFSLLAFVTFALVDEGEPASRRAATNPGGPTVASP